MALAPKELPQGDPEVLRWEGNTEVDSRLTGWPFKMHSGTGWLLNKVPLVSIPKVGKPGLTRRFKSVTQDGRNRWLGRKTFRNGRPFVTTFGARRLRFAII